MATVVRRTPAPLIGLVLLGLLGLQQATGWRWAWLGGWQDDGAYMQVSGLALLVVVAWQWRLSLLRARGHAGPAARGTEVHQFVGASAPLLFYLHSEQLGHAYLGALSLLFLAVVFTGLVNAGLTGRRASWSRVVRLPVHTGLSVVLLCLMAYHVFVSYAYE